MYRVNLLQIYSFIDQIKNSENKIQKSVTITQQNRNKKFILSIVFPLNLQFKSLLPILFVVNVNATWC